MTPLGRPIAIIAESIALPLIAIGIAYAATPGDPFLLKSNVPWLALAPILVALRYGVSLGMVSAVVLLLALIGWTGIGEPISTLYLLGTPLFTLVCGEYAGYWRSRLRHLSEVNGYLEDRSERITKRLFLIQLSHDRLEQDLLVRPATLRSALSELRLRVLDDASGGAVPGVEQFLEFIAQICQIESAAVYSGKSHTNAVARLGAPPSLAPDDILLARAIESGHLTHIRTRGIGNARSAGQAHLVVAPIIASNDHWIGTLVISKMPFAALNKDTLQLIAVLCAAYADVLAAAPDARRLAAELPNCPVEFADELTRLHRLSSRFSIDSQISCLSFGPSPRREELFATVLGMRRSPDCVWTLRQDENHLLITLIPFGEPGTTAGHLNRVRERLRTVTGAEMEELAISHLILSLRNPDAIERFKKIVVEAVPA